MPTTDVERLVVSLEASITKYERAMNKALGQSNATAAGIDNNFKKMNKQIEKSFDFSGVVTKGLAALGVGFSSSAAIQAVVAASAQFTDLQNALKVTGLEGAALEKTFSSLFQIAQKNGTAIAPLTTLYSRAAQSQKELNANSADLLKFTDGVSTALRVAGTSSTQAAGALLQLSQAIGSGVVRAEEFNSVNEGARPILQAVAAGLKEAGGSVATLKNLVNDGKITSEAFFRAFLAGMPQIEAQASKASGTIGQANERISNAFILLVGNLDKMTGASSNAARNLSALGGVLEGLPAYFEAASGKLDTFQQKLTELGNSSVWTKIAKFMGADLSLKGLQDAGISPPTSGIPDIELIQQSQQLAKITKDLLLWEGQLADARETAANTGLELDRKRVKSIEDTISALRTEQGLLQQRAQYLAKPDTGPGGRVAEGARDPLGQAPAPPTIKPVSVKDFKPPASKGDADTTAFERSTSQLEKRIALLKSEAETLGLGDAAGERARAVIELETAARKTNADAGLGQNVITAAQRVEIDKLANSYAAATQKLEQMNTPLHQLARSSADLSKQLNEMAANSLNSLTDELADVVTGTQTVQEAFSKMAAAIINDLAKIAIRQAITGPIAAGLAGLFGGGGVAGLLAGARAAGGPVTGGRPYLVGENGPEVMVPGRSGMVIPNSALRKAPTGGGAPSVVIYNNPTYQAGIGASDMAQIEAMQQQNNQQLRGVIISDLRRGVAADSRFLGQN